MKNTLRGRLGFTLIELLVVVLIIGILAAVALPQYRKAVDKVRLKKWIPYLQNLSRQADLYYMANGKYPLQLEDILDTPPFTPSQFAGCTDGSQERCVSSLDEGISIILQLNSGGLGDLNNPYQAGIRARMHTATEKKNEYGIELWFPSQLVGVINYYTPTRQPYCQPRGNSSASRRASCASLSREEEKTFNGRYSYWIL